MWFVKYIVLCYSLILWANNGKCIVIHIQNGLVLGYQNKTVDKNSDYIAFKGIPYAEPPINDLRFEPPVPKRNWEGTLDAKNDGNMCVQRNTLGDEDCLFINVYVPGTKLSGSLPIMVFIHGGGFENGNSNYASYGPDYLLEKDVIVVTFNYRLGIFGFLSTGDSVAPGNNGMKDQVLALKWVKNNIRHFGGDPNKVTIFGESAGAASVSYHMQSKLSQNLFRAAIMQSGTTLSSWALSRKIPAIVKIIAQILFIRTHNSRQLVNELKQTNYRLLQSVTFSLEIAEYLKHDPRHGLIFGPVSEPDHEEAFFTKKSHEFLKSGGFYRVPCIVGFNSLELVSFLDSVYSPLIGLYLLQYSFNSTRFVPIDLNVNNDKASAVGTLIKNHYFEQAPLNEAFNRFTKFLSDDFFVRPTVEFARQVARFIPTFLYRFSYEGDLGGTGNRTIPGVGHAEELNYIWRRKITLSQRDIAIRNLMILMWTNFAKILIPDGSKWKRTDQKILNYYDISEEPKSIEHPPQESDIIAFWFQQVYQVYGNSPYDTY